MSVLIVKSAATLAIFLFVITNMLSVGLGLSLTQILDPLRSTRFLLSSLIANFILVPMLACLIIRMIALDHPVIIAILLLSTGAGAPILPKLVEFARGDLAYAVALMVMLMAATVVYMPIVLPMLLPAAHVAPWQVARPLVTVILMPLSFGVLVRAGKPSLAGRIQPYLRRTSTMALFLAVSLALAANYRETIHTVGIRVILAAGLLQLFSFIFGFTLGGPSLDTRKALAFGTAQRDISAAFLVAVENIADFEVLSMLIVVALFGVCIQVPAAIALGRWTERPGAGACEDLGSPKPNQHLTS